ncbi:MAG: hypothetical protein CVU98_05660 [Firmicutes bacterium HGW-Firmicutes-3]|nr:MAG: hypothetical protein CVU98_05660 [Firmicutes bacterium HGW-Firmicutes-3]
MLNKYIKKFRIKAWTVFLSGIALFLLTACSEAPLKESSEQVHQLVGEYETESEVEPGKEVAVEQEEQEAVEKELEPEEETSQSDAHLGTDEGLPLTFLENLHQPNYYFTFGYDDGTYCQMEGTKAQTFYSRNAIGERIHVQKVEEEGRVYYIMADAGKLVSYQGPATDFLYDIMLEAASQEQQQQKVLAEGTMYEYWMPFHHDEEINWRYQFVMANGTLTELRIFFGENLWQHHHFHHFGNIPMEDLEGYLPDAFHIPQGFYEEEHYDATYDGEKAPPWWEMFLGEPVEE